MSPVAVLASLAPMGGSLPPTFLIGCIAADVDERMGLSAPVEGSVESAVGVVRELLNRLVRTGHRPRGSAADMRLGIPGKVVGRVEGYGDQLVLVDVLGAQRQINIGMLEDADQAALATGDWVLIHMGLSSNWSTRPALKRRWRASR